MSKCSASHFKISSRSSQNKKSCEEFKLEWLSLSIETEMPSSKSSQISTVKLGDIFEYRSNTNDIIGKIYSQANSKGEFTSGKKSIGN